MADSDEGRSAPERMSWAPFVRVKMDWMPRHIDSAMRDERSYDKVGDKMETGSRSDRQRSATKSWTSQGAVISAKRAAR